jgi:hypothetical protein
LHPIYDYHRYFEAAKLKAVTIKRFPLGALFPASFDSITAVKV